jgi:hypothetical protein
MTFEMRTRIESRHRALRVRRYVRKRLAGIVD